MHALSPTRRASSLGAVVLPLPQPATLILTNWRQSETHISNKAEHVRGMGIPSGCLQANSNRAEPSRPARVAVYALRLYRPPLVHARSAILEKLFAGFGRFSFRGAVMRGTVVSLM
jgi:hypothetical protein